MSFRLVDQPEDRPAFLRETIDILSRDLEDHRARLLERVARATDEELLAGSEDDWGIGMIAYHLLVSERGMVGIALRLARGEVPTSTGQPRPEPRTTTRQVLMETSAKVAAALERLRREFPSAPALDVMAPSPYFGPFNCFSWLLAARFHYQAHLEALERGTRSAL